jgi:hypothetical protein
MSLWQKRKKKRRRRRKTVDASIDERMGLAQAGLGAEREEVEVYVLLMNHGVKGRGVEAWMLSTSCREDIQSFGDAQGAV